MSACLRFAATLALVVVACAASRTEAEQHPFVVDGYREAVFNVSDLDRQVEFYRAVAGWEMLHSARMPASRLERYGLTTDVTAREAVLGNPGTSRGFIRLVEFTGVAQQQIRSNAQAWDTGGFFDVNARVLDMQRKFSEFQARDWQAASDPVEFSFGPFVVKEWLTRGPDGIVLALIERVEPPLEGWLHLREISRLFNATQVVADASAAKAFYVDKLGFEIYLEHTAPSERPEQNVLGLPHNLAATVPREVFILHPDGTNEGSIEVLGFDGAVGRDFADRVKPQNLGIFTLRFPVRDVDRFSQDLAQKDVEIIHQPMVENLEPYGSTRVLAIRGPGGVWLEFFEEL